MGESDSVLLVGERIKDPHPRPVGQKALYGRNTHFFLKLSTLLFQKFFRKDRSWCAISLHICCCLTAKTRAGFGSSGTSCTSWRTTSWKRTWTKEPSLASSSRTFTLKTTTVRRLCSRSWAKISTLSKVKLFSPSPNFKNKSSWRNF